MAPHRHSPGRSRRQFLLKYFRWTLTVAAAGLVHPLLRFSGYTVKPQPRYITVTQALPAGGVFTDRDFLLFMLDDGPVAVSRRCPHLGCRVNFRQELGAIECPCHQSRFTVQGKRISGPAQDDLRSFPVKRLEDNDGETTGYRVTL